MPLTVRQLVADPTLRITLRAGAEHADRELSWAHVSELDDPAAFLSGGELLLTTGVALSDSDEEIANWVRRLVAAGVAALGFGVGLRYDDVPAAVLDTARAEGLPLVEVPLEVPFILLEKAVYQALSSEDHARLQLSHQQQRRLIHATLAADGAKTLVRRTAQLIGGWAALLDAAGDIVDSTHRSARRAVEQTARARRSGPGEIVFSTEGGEDVISHPLTAADGRVLGYLVAGREGVVGSLDHGVVTIAASLLTLFVRRTEQSRDALARAREAAMKMLIAGQISTVEAMADELWGGLPTEPIVVFTAQGDPRRLSAACELFEVHPHGAIAFALIDDHLSVIASHASANSALARLTSVSGLFPGISGEASWGELARAIRESRQAADDAARRQETTKFTAVISEGLSACFDRDRARAYAEAHLAPLLDSDRGGSEALRSTLEVWLAHNGQIDPAAKTLGIHRHTLRRRLDRIERLLGISLESPTSRSELWLELQLIDSDVDR
ncbi:PucR family transcriptional regulator ligand-binding domain-containing protein [Nocardia sp. bgisy118]|uniref:PucR family transcriptional regulator ligand-binding domain-containing protein n=1 Tax=Nocardia sp. bgisy118 TaxID=3413786 RepID=UPI003F4A4989